MIVMKNKAYVFLILSILTIIMMAGGVIISEHQKRRDSLKAAKENAPSANINLSTIDELSETYVKNFDIKEIISLQNKDSFQNKRSTLL